METKEASQVPRSRGGSRGLTSHDFVDPHADDFPASSGVDQGSKTRASLPEFISSRSFGISLLSFLPSLHTPLGNFVKQSLNLHMMKNASRPSNDPWPCPIPESLPSPKAALTGRRRSRWKLRVCIREHLRSYVATCNWLVLGRPKQVDSDVSRQPMSNTQRQIVDRLESSLRVWYRQSSGFCSDLSRSEMKFSSMNQLLEELDACSHRLRASFDPYGKPRDRQDPVESDLHVPTSEAVCAEERKVPRDSNSSGKPVLCQPSRSATAVELNPDRLKFSYAPNFGAIKFISDPFVKAGFDNPRHFRLPRSCWPRVKPARVMCQKEQLLRLFKKWDDVHSLRLVAASDSEFQYRCGLFAVYKNAEKDRQILNPIPENGRCLSIPDSTRSLSHGTLLCNLFLDEHEDLAIAANDLEDYYHCFLISAEHANRNHIHGVFKGDIFKGWNCWDPSYEGKFVVGCFNTLAMGTNFAVEIAQHTHSNLLLRAGCLKVSQQVRYRHPFPRSKTIQLLCIDDFAILHKVPRNSDLKSLRKDREDSRLMAKAEQAYKAENLRVSEKKAVKDAKHATILGGEIDGSVGLVTAPRLRVLTLCILTLKVVKLGVCTRHLLQSILGCWVFVLLFRRPFFSLLSEVFHDGEDAKEHEIFTLSTGTRQELMLLVLWSPFASTNLRAQPLERLFCTDASLEGGGVCDTSVPKGLTLELGRLAEQKGFYTRVDASTLGKYAALHEMKADLDISIDQTGAFPIDSSVTDRQSSIPANLSEGFLWDFCEVFRGTGHLSKAHRELGLQVHPGFEIKDGPHGDIMISSTFLAIVGLIARRVVRSIHVAPVCTTFGTLRKPRVRSKVSPFGFDPQERATAEGNHFAVRAAFLLFLCVHYRIWGTAEQPGGSVMFRLDIYRRLLESGFFSIRFPFCSWGTPFQKKSWWIGNNPLLTVLNGTCSCGYSGRHFRVQGVFDKLSLKRFAQMCRPDPVSVFGRLPLQGEHVAKFSGGYPLALCRKIAALNFQIFSKQDDDFGLALAPSSSSPRWVSEIGRSLTWHKTLQYRFRKLNHININEALAYRSLLKHLAKTEHSRRFVAFLDSRVVIGSSSKGRSSSKQLNFYLSSMLPYLTGSDLYPFLIHMASKENPSDDVSRFVDLRSPAIKPPTWLEFLLKGDHSWFDQVVQADRFIWPYNGWCRLIRLLFVSRGNL